MILPGSLLEEAKNQAHKEGASLTKVVEKALQDYLAKKRAEEQIKSDKNHVNATDLAPSSRKNQWGQIRSEMYIG